MATTITVICAGWVENDGTKHECGVVIETITSEQDTELTTSHGLCQSCFEKQMEQLNSKG